MEISQAEKNKSFVHKDSNPNSKLLQIEREFNVPLDKLFTAFAKPDILKIWWWPKGLYADRIDYDFREGGKYFINMQGSAQGGGGMTGHFEKIIPNECIVMTDQFANEKGQAISAKEANMPGQWPEVGYITFEFESVGANRSRFKLSQQGIPNEMQDDCVQGWSESFDKLQNFLDDRKH